MLGTIHKVSKRKRGRRQRSQGQSGQGLEDRDKAIGFSFKCDWKPLKVLRDRCYRSDFQFKNITLVILGERDY